MEVKPKEPRPELVAFCSQMRPTLVGAMRLYLHDSALAEEFAQEALARTCVHWHKVRKMENPRGWVYKVALNLARSHLRRLQIERRANARLERTSATLPDDATSIAIRDALKALPRRHREAVVLRFFADLTVAETADVLGCPVNTVKSWTKRGIEGLQKGLVEEEVFDHA
jgi:RNA polymerase sigma factor (sigma-70 family)